MKKTNEKVLLYAPIHLGDFIWFTSVLDLIYSYDKNIKVSLIIFEEHKKLISVNKFNIDKIITISKMKFSHENKLIRYIYKFFWLIDIFKIIKFYNYNLIFFTIPPKIFIKIFSKLYMFKNIISLDSVFQGSKIEKEDYKYFSKIIDTIKLKNSHFIMKFQTLIRSVFHTYDMAIPILPDTRYLENKIKSLIGKTKRYKVAFCTRGSTDWKFLDIEFLKDLILQIDKIYGATFFIAGSGNSKFDDTDKLKNLLPNKDIRSIYNKTSLSELIEFMKNMDLLISIDTGVVHIAAAVNTPVISLCGPTLPIHSAPIYHKGITLYSGRFCSPCDTQINTNNKICKDMKCLRDITADMVLKSVKELLNEGI